MPKSQQPKILLDQARRTLRLHFQGPMADTNHQTERVLQHLWGDGKCRLSGALYRKCRGIMLTRIAREKALPFEPLIPNDETIAAMKEARLSSLPSFKSDKLNQVIEKVVEIIKG